MVRFWWITQEVLGWDVLATSQITRYVVSLLLRVYGSHPLSQPEKLDGGRIIFIYMFSIFYSYQTSSIGQKHSKKKKGANN